MSETRKEKLLQELRAHAKEQVSLDKKQIALVQRAHKAGVSLQDVGEILGLSLRTVYNRVEGKGPRAGADWRA